MIKFPAVLLFLVALLVGCGGSPPSPSATDVGAQQGTAFPTLPSPSATPLPSSTLAVPTVSPGANPSPPTQTIQPTPPQARTLAAPSVLASFDLNPLPGEGRAPSALAMLGDDLYVANRTTQNLGVIQAGRVRAFVTLPGNPSALVSDAAHNRIYASSYETPTLYLVENEKLVAQATAGGRINALALDEDTLFVALDSDAIIERFDANTLVKKGELNCHRVLESVPSSSTKRAIGCMRASMAGSSRSI